MAFQWLGRAWRRVRHGPEVSIEEKRQQTREVLVRALRVGEPEPSADLDPLAELAKLIGRKDPFEPSP